VEHVAECQEKNGRLLKGVLEEVMSSQKFSQSLERVIGLATSSSPLLARSHPRTEQIAFG
jgi:hypothetical protein